MRRTIIASLVALFMASSPQFVAADVRTDQRVRFQLGGALGKIVNMFGGRGAREGVTTTVAVKGDRKATMSDQNGQIIDLAEEKIYDLDIRRKTYTVTTFAERRAQMEKARRDAEQRAAREQARERDEPAQPAEKDPNAREFEVDFAVKNTGAKRAINGFDTTQTVVTITVREKGKTLEQSGGLVVNSDMWLAPNAPSTRELAEFDMRYAQKIFGPMVAGASAQDLAMAMAMYPMIKPALDKMREEGAKVDGTAILTTMTMEAVPPAGQAGEQAQAAPAESPRPRGLAGRLGGLAKRAVRKDEPAKGNATILTTSVEMLKLTTDVAADAVALPAGFKEVR
jgi:hypothetical protein